MTELFPATVYILCFIASAVCAWLLGRSYRQTGVPLLLWSSVCFALLAANNFVLVLDLVVWTGIDLRLERVALLVAAVSSLLWGFVSEAEGEG
jgi:hypothetical protein